MPQTKIATCCYCSARTIFKLTARQGHELACASCGAPLHEMKWLKKPQENRSKSRHPKKSRQSVAHQTKPRKIRRRRNFKRLKDWLEDAWDEIEDIFD